MSTTGDWFGELQAQVSEDSAHVPAGATPAVADTLAEEHPERHAISGNRYDEFLYDTTSAGVEALSTTLDETRARYEHTDALASDILRSMYQLEPREQPPDPAYQRNAAAIHDMLSTTDYKRLHSLTQLDDFAAALATASMTEELVDVLSKQEEEDKKRLRQAKDEQQRQREKQPEPPEAKQEETGRPQGLPGQEGQSGGTAPTAGGTPDPSGLQSGASQASSAPGPANGQEKEEAARESLRQMQRRVAARKAVKQAEQLIEEAQTALDTFSGQPDAVGGGWGSESGKAQLMGDVQARARLAMQIVRNDTLRRIAQLCGRMKMVAAQVERTRLTLGNTELYGVTIGNDIRSVLPTELVLLSRPALKRLFYAKFAERSLNQYERYSPEPVGRGPIIVVDDESGSMRGQKNEWAKAVVLSLLSIAAKQKRDLRVIHFASAANLLVEDYPKGRGSTDQVLATALHFYGGGTDYEAWMKSALSAIESSDYDRADIVAVSDGECAVSDELLRHWQATKAARGFRAIGILTGAPRGGAILRQFCDEVNHLKSVREDQAILEQMFTMTV